MCWWTCLKAEWRMYRQEGSCEAQAIHAARHSFLWKPWKHHLSLWFVLEDTISHCIRRRGCGAGTKDRVQGSGTLFHRGKIYRFWLKSKMSSCHEARLSSITSNVRTNKEPDCLLRLVFTCSLLNLNHPTCDPIPSDMSSSELVKTASSSSLQQIMTKFSLLLQCWSLCKTQRKSGATIDLCTATNSAQGVLKAETAIHTLV